MDANRVDVLFIRKEHQHKFKNEKKAVAIKEKEHKANILYVGITPTQSTQPIAMGNLIEKSLRKFIDRIIIIAKRSCY